MYTKEEHPKDPKLYLGTLDLEMRRILEGITTQFERVQTVQSQIALKEMMIAQFEEVLESVTLAADTFLDDEADDAKRAANLN